MPPPPHTKPENVLKRAQELMGVEQQTAALSLLHEHVTSKRTRNSPIASLEPVMLLFVELCVELRRGKSAKDGLYSYKNTAQNTNVGTIEMVLKRFIELAEQKVTEAQAKADQVQTSLESTTTSAAIDDLEASETPESILLSTVSGEQSRDRTDRAIVTPWLKFLWETYRTVLDILKNNARLEVMYQSTAHQAFQFCLKYTRKTEFRRLCELLRNHLQNAAKYSSQMNAINLSDPDTLQRHLDTRFQQLNVAVELELWQEAFRSIEDIHTLLNLSKRPAKNIMMANYFEKLTRIFLVSENFLFHAAAWSRYYNLLRQSAAVVATGQSPKKDNPSVTEQETTKVASYVLLSALAIPVISTTRSRGVLIDVDETRKSKNTRLTNLLGMNAAPTRASIFKDALSKGLLRKARPEIRELYNILEVEFHPLSICKRISPILSQIGADPEMEKYVLPLQQVILTRLFQQLSQVYESVELKFVLDLAQFPDPYQVSSSTVEKFIMNGCKKGDLAIRIDHATGVLTFDSDVFSSSKALHPGSGAGSAEDASAVQRLQSTPAEIVRSSLTRLAKTLFVTCQYVDPTFNEDRQKAKQAALLRAREGAEQEHLETLQRKEIITKRKETAASVTAAREKEEAHRKRLQAQQLQAAETERLEREQRKRDEDRLKAEKDRIRRAEIEKELQTLKEGIKGVDLNEFNIDDLDTGRIRAIKLAALEKEKNELGYKLRVTGRRIDHLERAFRQEEIKHLPADYEAQRQLDLEAYEKSKEETMKEAQLKHTEDVALKHRLSRLVSPYEKFRDQVRQQRHAEFEKRRKAAEKELQNKMDQRKREIRERKAKERREREEAARKAREEEERLAKEAEETAAKEEKERQKKAEALARREEERKEREESARKKLQREQEAEEHRRQRKEQERASATAPPSRLLERTAAASERIPQRVPERTPSTEPTMAGPPRIALAGNKPTWREREAAKRAGGDVPPEAVQAAPPASANDIPTAEADLPKRTGGYVLPGRREGGAISPAARDDRFEAPPATDRWRPRTQPREASPATAGELPSGRYSAPRSGIFERRDSPAGRDGGRLAGGGSGLGRDGRDGDRDGNIDGLGRTESPSAAAGASATGEGKPGAYRPGMFKGRGRPT